MKTALALAAALCMSLSVASACPGKVSASVDKDTIVASTATGPISTPADAVRQEKAK